MSGYIKANNFLTNLYFVMCYLNYFKVNSLCSLPCTYLNITILLYRYLHNTRLLFRNEENSKLWRFLVSIFCGFGPRVSDEEVQELCTMIYPLKMIKERVTSMVAIVNRIGGMGS